MYNFIYITSFYLSSLNMQLFPSNAKYFAILLKIKEVLCEEKLEWVLLRDFLLC